MRGRGAAGAVAVAALLASGCSNDEPEPVAEPGDATTTAGEVADGSDDVEPVDVAALEEQARAAAGQVVVRARTFTPATVTIATGQAVAWRFEDGQVPHGVVGDGFDSPARTHGVTVHTFTEPGTYPFRCPVHPDEMQGTVEVR